MSVCACGSLTAWRGFFLHQPFFSPLPSPVPPPSSSMPSSHRQPAPHLAWKVIKRRALQPALGLDAGADVLVASDDILQGGGHEKVFLLQPQLLALKEVVVWVQHARNVLGDVAVNDSLDVVAVVEVRQVKAERMQ